MTEQGPAVAVLIDFENLAYGIREKYGEDAYADHLNLSSILDLAKGLGPIVLANAYADWRFKEVNQFQVDLYRSGIELVHVLGKTHNARMKNAVDVKLAVDAIETLFLFPRVEVFVIVSGDRDFIHVLKTLRRHGKSVIGISPTHTASKDFIDLCDRFLPFESSTDTPEPKPERTANGLDGVRHALREILARSPSGMKGAAVKPALQQRLGSTFNEGTYGYKRLTGLLRALPETVEVILNPRAADVTVRLARGGDHKPAKPVATESAGSEVARRLTGGALAKSKFEPNRKRRLCVLHDSYDAMTAAPPFTLDEVIGRLSSKQIDLGLPSNALIRWYNVLYQSHAFSMTHDQENLTLRTRPMRLEPMIRTAADFVFRFEASIALKVAVSADKMEVTLTAPLLGEILGFRTEDWESDDLDGAAELPADVVGSTPESDRAYCERLLAYAADVQTPVKPDPGAPDDRPIGQSPIKGDDGEALA